MIKHECKFNKDLLCDYCGRFQNLSLAESKVYRNGLVGGCFEESECWWILHHKHFGLKKP